MKTTGVILMAYGGPDSLEDVEPYLLDVRGGRPTSKELVEEIKDRYAQIGGRSPLLEITRRQASALEAELNNRSPMEQRFKVVVGMRHWEPRIHAAVDTLVNEGIQTAVAIVMAPHYSKMSTEVYLNRLFEAVEGAGAEIQIFPIRSWHHNPDFIHAVEKHARIGLEKFAGAQPYVLFTAHSLPARILENGDPYADQLHETARLVAKHLGLEEGRWSFSFQSAGRTSEPWLGPKIEEEVPRLAKAGERNILVVPVGFVADHVEVLYDIDIEARKTAGKFGARLERSPSLNDSPAFIQALAGIVTSEGQKIQH